MIGYLDDVRRPLIVIVLKMSRYFKSNNKLMFFHVGTVKLLVKFKIIWTKNEDLQNQVKLKVLPVYDNIYIKSKIRICGDKVYTNVRGLNLQKLLLL